MCSRNVQINQNTTVIVYLFLCCVCSVVMSNFKCCGETSLLQLLIKLPVWCRAQQHSVIVYIHPSIHPFTVSHKKNSVNIWGEIEQSLIQSQKHNSLLLYTNDLINILNCAKINQDSSVVRSSAPMLPSVCNFTFFGQRSEFLEEFTSKINTVYTVHIKYYNCKDARQESVRLKNLL